MLKISQTGVRSGEMITNSLTASQNRGSLFRVRGLYPPSLQRAAELSVTEVRDLLSQIPFFSRLTPTARLQWLTLNGVTNDDLYIEDTGLEVLVISLNGKFFDEKLTPEQRDLLIRGNPHDPEGYWPIADIYNMIPRNPGSKGRRHTLIFRPSNWSVYPENKLTEEFSGYYIDLSDWNVKQGTIRTADVGLHAHRMEPPEVASRVASPTQQGEGYIKVFPTQRLKAIASTFAIYEPRMRSVPLIWDHIISLAESVSRAGIREEIIEFRSQIEFFPPSLHKSLLQKLVRTRCKFVSVSGRNYSSDTVLLTTLSMLMMHPGAFVPNIQRFVSGLESVTKRSAVTICEDSYIDDPRLILGLYAGAAVAQVDRDWRPTDLYITLLFRAMLSAQQDRRLYVYNHHGRNDMDGITAETPLVLKLMFVLLSEVKSFESDIQMMGSIAENQGRFRQDNEIPSLLETMPLCHCIDHHSFSEIALFMEPAVVVGRTVFESVFNKIWNLGTAVNPRNEKYKDWTPENPDYQEILRAQQRLWRIKSGKKKTIIQSVPNERYELQYKLDSSWIAGLIGPIEVKVGSTHVLVVVRCDDISSFSAIKRPSRETKAPDLTEDEKEAAIGKARVLLQNGWILKDVPETLATLKNAKVYYREDDYYILLNREVEFRKWADWINMKFSFPVLSSGEVSIDAALHFTGDGIMQNADTIFDHILQTPKTVIGRMLTYLDENRSMIEMYKISREGDGVEYAVLPEDVPVTLFFCYICCLYPACLERVVNGYQVKNGPLLWSLRDRIRSVLRTSVQEKTSWKTPVPNQRKLWEHQKSTIIAMIDRHTSGNKGHIIWIPPGLGKTMILLMYLKHLIEIREMPAYCIYTLPPSAVDSISSELEQMQIPYQVMDMRQNSTMKTIRPGIVNLVFHDHMRMNGLDVEMKKLAPQLFFIIDEFHKTMNKTIRTSIALEVSRLAVDFVAMSGSIISNGDLTDIVQWVCQIVSFEVTTTNVFVAIGAIISRRVQTHVVVEEVEIDAALIDENYYKTLVPRLLGGVASTTNFKAAVTASNEAIFAETLKQSLLYLRAGEKIFICAKDLAQQQRLAEALHSNGIVDIFLIDKGKSITLTPEMQSPIQVVITTISHVEG